MNDGKEGKVDIKRERKESTKERRKRKEEKVKRKIKKIQENEGWKYINRNTNRNKKVTREFG